MSKYDKNGFEAKKELSKLYRNEECIVGFGIGRLDNHDTMRVYISDARFPLVEQLSQDGEFEGFALEIQTVGLVETFPVKSY